MNKVIDQAKFLNEVKPYWADLEQCVNFDIRNGKCSFHCIGRFKTAIT
jgi:hypothetical protein